MAERVKVRETTPGGTRSGSTGPSSYQGSVTTQENAGHRTLPAELLLLPGKGKDRLLKPFPALHFQDAITAAQALTQHIPGAALSPLTFTGCEMLPSHNAESPPHRSHGLSQDLPRLKIKAVSNKTG